MATASNFGIPFPPRNIKVFNSQLFKNYNIIKIVDAKFPYKLSYFEPICLTAKMAAKTVMRMKVYCVSHHWDQGNIASMSTITCMPVISEWI